MKICKQCQADNPDTSHICESCSAAMEPAAAEKKKAGWILPVMIAVLLVGLFAGCVQTQEPAPEADPSISEPADDPESDEPEEEIVAGEVLAEPVSNGHHINAYGFPSHSIHFVVAEDGTVSYSYLNEAGETVTVTEEEVKALMAREVASCASETVTNDRMMYYYDDQVYSFQNNYSSYMGFLVNLEKPLDEQICMDGVNTWEQSFLASSLQMFHQLAAMKAEAKASGFVMPEEQQARVDVMLAELTEAGKNYGFENADTYMQAYFGPLANVNTYLDYFEDNLYVSSYLSKMQEEMTYTDEELDAYYAENEASLNANGIFKSDKNVVNIRHILIQPVSSTASDGTTSISDEAWADAEAKAQQIYDEWLAGDATEETFAEFAGEYTQDPGSMTTGGLYEEVFPGQMVAEFNDWCFADGRATGDHGIVKTSYGFHIMFFSGEGDYIYWKEPAAMMLKMDKLDQYLEEITEKYELTSDPDQFVMLNRLEPTAPETEEEAE